MTPTPDPLIEGSEINSSARTRLVNALALRFRRVGARFSALLVLFSKFGRRYLPNEGQHLFALTLLVGAACGLVAVAFHLAIRGAEQLLIEHALHAPGDSWMAWTIITPTLGGLIAGAALTWLVPGARGSGIPQVKQAFATEGGRIRFRDALGKFVVGTLQIGSGASLGREGPTVQICAGATSLLARVTSLPPRNLRRLTPVGVAAGIAAAFNAPIAAVTFTIEEIVGTLDQSVLSGVIVAAALAAVIERGILGVHPVIEVTTAYGLDHASSLPLYALLGIAAAFVSIAFTEGLLRVRAWFQRLRAIPKWAHPGVGGLVTGLLAVVLLRFLGAAGITGGGYETLGRALDGELGLRVLLALCAAKLVATVLSYSSGGAGGIFAPALFVGAMLGGAVGHLDVLLLGHEKYQLGAFALVGMGAVFAGVIRAPITSVLIIFEMTGGYGLVLPLMLANMSSYMLARHLRPTPIYEALLAQDGIHIPQSTQSPHPIDQLRVSDAMTREDDLRTTSSDSTLTTLMRPANVIHRDESLLRAVVKMNDLGVRQLVVIDGTDERPCGLLAMSDVVRAHARAYRGADRGSKSSLSLRPLPEKPASSLMVHAELAERSTKLSDLIGRLRDRPDRPFVIPNARSGFSAILPEHLGEFARDEEFGKMLIAADVARPVASVQANATLPELVRELQAGQFEAALVLDASGAPMGIVTKAALAMGLLDWYVSSLDLS